MNRTYLRGRMAGAILSVSLLLGVMFVANTTALAQRTNDRDSQNQRDRDQNDRRDRDGDRNRRDDYGRNGRNGNNAYQVAQNQGYQDGLNVGANDGYGPRDEQLPCINRALTEGVICRRALE